MYRVARGGAAWAVAMVALGGSSAAQAQQSSAPLAGTQSPDDGAALDPNSPMAPLPGLGVDWPDLATAPGAADATQAEHAEIAADIRYSYAVKGLEDSRDALLRQRFDDLSTLKAHQGDPANAAQLVRRAREDSDLDLLFEVPNTTRFSLFDQARIQNALTAELKTPVDLLPREGLRPRQQQRIEAELIRVF